MLVVVLKAGGGGGGGGGSAFCSFHFGGSFGSLGGKYIALVYRVLITHADVHKESKMLEEPVNG